MNTDLDAFTRKKVMVIGDLMLDEYLWGDVERISPEAPVPIVSVRHENFRLGGAGNVVNNLVDLGAQVMVSGIIGAGARGQLLLDCLAALNIETGGIVQVDDRPTIRKTRIIASDQQVLRIDWEKVAPVPDRFLPPIYRFIEQYVPEVDAVIVSDYGKGLISESLMETITGHARKHNKFAVADPKGMDFTRYAGVNMVTPNKKEASLAAGIDIIDEDSLNKAGRRLLDIVGSESMLITLGKDGMVLMRDQQAPFPIKARSKQVYDVSGAGDTVLAVMGLSAAAGFCLEDSARLANIAAGIVVGKIGTATVTVDELKAALSQEQ